jgi:DNA-binding GntR family transcriptional regulator
MIAIPAAAKHLTPRQPLAEQAYAELKRRILDNVLSLGMQRLEHEFAAEAGVSCTPVREAIVRLKQ